MRRTPRSLTDARDELVQSQEEFTRLQKRIEAVRDCVTDSLARFFGELRPAFTGLKEEELIERIAGRVVARIDILPPKPKTEAEPQYFREHAAAKNLGVSASTLRSWRGKRRTVGLPVTRVGKMVLHSVKELERFMQERTVHRAPVGDSL
jgi:hypothetical protein